MCSDGWLGNVHFCWPFYESDPQDWLRKDQGFVEYRYLERVAICMESGLSLREGMVVAADEIQREIGERYTMC